jgi:catechol 2,3-dioxygenase-like lactoylglutathione lyase family enzyme
MSAGDDLKPASRSLAKGVVVPIESCIPVIPSADLEKSLRLWVDGLGFEMSSEIRKDDKLIFCMLRKADMFFMLNQRAGTLVKPKGYEGIRLYWTPTDLHEIRERLRALGFHVSELRDRDYGQTEFFLTDNDGYSHCFGVATQR